MIAGGAAILAGVLAQTSGSRTTRSAGAVGVIGGGALLKSGLEKRAESNIHSLALEELGQSLDAEITPRVIELEDRTVRLTGNVEDQYDQWRELLADIYAAELAALEPPAPPAGSLPATPESQDFYRCMPERGNCPVCPRHLDQDGRKTVHYRVSRPMDG